MERLRLYQETQQVLPVALSTLLQVPHSVFIVSMFPGTILIYANWQTPRKSLGKLQGTAKARGNTQQTVRHGHVFRVGGEFAYIEDELCLATCPCSFQCSWGSFSRIDKTLWILLCRITLYLKTVQHELNFPISCSHLLWGQLCIRDVCQLSRVSLHTNRCRSWPAQQSQLNCQDRDTAALSNDSWKL